MACLLLCHVGLSGMNTLTPVAGISPPLNPSRRLVGYGLGFELQRKERRKLKRKLKLVVSAQLSKSFSLNLGLDSQIIHSRDLSQLPWIGPVPGDIAEVEAYCRIFRAAEGLHAALMDTLCNPLTGECKVSYDFTLEEKPLLEDKIVSALGCMIALLNKGREDVLSGRSSIMNSFRVADLSALEDKAPPLAIFRNEMKRCCESLHVALENYLTPDDDRSLHVWRKLQRLKNVCYDSGFPRQDDYPCHTLFANWAPVYLSTSKEDIESENSEVAFWRGGQLTEEGLCWLVEKGFKTIVDLRAETVKDNFYEAALDDAILSAKVELVKIPVEVRTAPSMDQVEKFASLVSDCRKKPIYLHSKEGVWRASAMVSRWRQYMTRSGSQVITHSDISLQETNGRGELKSSTISEGRSNLGQEDGSLKVTEDRIHNSNEVSLELASSVKGEKDQSSNEAHNGPTSVQGTGSMETVSDDMGSFANIYRETDPLKAQLPPSNFFSKAEMSRFFRTKKISPTTYSTYQFKKFKNFPISIKPNTGEFVDTDRSSRLVEAEGSNVSAGSKNVPPNHQIIPADGDKFLNVTNGASVGSYMNTLGEEGRNYGTETNGSLRVNETLNGHLATKSVEEDSMDNGAASSSSSDDELCPVEGNMCASATGVVRVQSRRKAEMFLVRTDGFSCTREKVTESSLAFTHPSTQQQMLMWKSTPKTVLLLKKLGQELMEEAKEVASFLYHQEEMNVLVEPDVHDIFARIPGFGFVQTFYSQDTSDLHERVDFVACLGGDGVILHASNLFRGAVPPVVSFNLGSLGFLTSHNFEDFRQDLKQVIHGNNTLDGVYITLRMRLRCEIFRNGKAMPGKIFDVLNEMVVDRGSNPYLSKIECYEHDRLITKVQGDGVIVATPTGSTAYSTAAGGSMVHPNVPCMLFTPICPHSLSFRPVILPDSARLELKIPDDARSNAWVSFDGKRRQQLSRGDSVRIHMSQHPLPTVNKSDQTGDWFHSLIRCLNWNERLDQKAL
ncbi:NAD kinase 2, mitochondrial [Turnera subulata]|uniref:NAD(+) kinase n=1 Tax=Turnera subulata TaxID=218843 RepID=A0A9Q0JCG1_9ROSI|nr:NAD kinase 2, mitochondrial [Turnera subulata]